MRSLGVKSLRLPFFAIELSERGAEEPRSKMPQDTRIEELVIPLPDLSVPSAPLPPRSENGAIPLPYVGEPAIKTDSFQDEDELLFWSSDDDAGKPR